MSSTEEKKPFNVRVPLILMGIRLISEVKQYNAEELCWPCFFSLSLSLSTADCQTVHL